MLFSRRPSLVLLGLILGCSQPGDEPASLPGSAARPRTASAPSTAARPEVPTPAQAKVAAPTEAAAEEKAARPTATPGSTPPPTTPRALPPETAALLRGLTARPEETPPIAPPILTFELRKDRVWISDGERAAPMDIHAESVGETTRRRLDDGGVEVTLRYTDEVRCDGPELSRTYGADALRARIEGTAAYRRHRAGAFDEAARGFALAATLDPAPDKRWSNLACALSRAGELDRALLALRPLLERNPVAAYAKVASDPDLRPLRERPEITRLRATKPGSATLAIRENTLQGFVFAGAAALETVARLERSDSGGTCQFRAELSFYSSEGGEEQLRLPLIHLHETEEMCGLDAEGAPPSIRPDQLAAVQGRLVHANRLLRDLGFESSPNLDRLVLSGAEVVTLPTSALEVTIGDDTVSVRRDGTPIASAPRGRYTWLGAAGYDPLTEVVFVEWGNDLPEGCASDLAPAGTLVIPLREG